MSEIHNMKMDAIHKKVDGADFLTGWSIGCVCGWESGKIVTVKELADDYNEKDGKTTICKEIYAKHGDKYKKKKEPKDG